MSISKIRGPVDIIFCRNVMIYFDINTRKKVTDQFYYLLSPGGYLCLGIPESLLGIDKRFTLIGSSIYNKINFKVQNQIVYNSRLES